MNSPPEHDNPIAFPVNILIPSRNTVIWCVTLDERYLLTEENRANLDRKFRALVLIGRLIIRF